MKTMLIRLVSVLCAALLLAGNASASGAEIIFDDGEPLLIEEVVDGQAVWRFPVALEDMQPRFVTLANKYMLLSKDFVPDPLVTVKTRKKNKDGTNANGGVYKASGSAMQLQGDCLQAFVSMSEGALADGITLYLKSAYRSYRTQKTMYYNRLERNKGKDDGWVSKPGASDHQTGLGLDVVSRSWRDKAMNSSFAATKEAQWMAAHCAEYGFIIRYPEDKTALTEINYEPWHLRYVGIPAAAYIMENGLCLEEFCEQLWAACSQYLAEGGSPEAVVPFMQESANNGD